MDMFKTYDSLPEDYIPNNTVSNTTTEYKTINNTSLKKIFNAKNSFVGYGWDYGDTVTLRFSCKEDITVSSDSIVYETANEGPTSHTVAKAGQQAYNTVDSKSWTCVGQTDGLYIWVEDDELIYPEDGTRVITLAPDMTDKELVVELYNFRWELLHSFSKQGAIDISVDIGKDISATLKPGIYYSLLKVTGINSSDVRQKTMLVVE